MWFGLRKVTRPLPVGRLGPRTMSFGSIILGTAEEIYPRVLRVFSALEHPAMV